MSDFLNKTKGVHYHNREEIRFFCRGQSSLRLKLRPKIGRFKYTDNDLDQAEPSWKHKFEKMFSQFEREYIMHHDGVLSRKIDKMTLAQHYGLATPLLDWSLNPLIALYFACEKQNKEDGIVFIFTPITSSNIQSDSDLVKAKHWEIFRPIRFDQRMINQDTVFTHHPDPTEDFADTLGERCNGVFIPAGKKVFILRELASIGFHKAFVFPGLSSICEIIDSAYKKSWKYSENWPNDKGLGDGREPYLIADTQVL